MASQVPGCLIIDDSGSIFFVSSENKTILNISGVPAINPDTESLEISFTQASQRPSRAIAPAEPVATQIGQPVKDEANRKLVIHGLESQKYADILYPRFAAEIMADVLDGQYTDDSDPEGLIDSSITHWVTSLISDRDKYFRDMVVAAYDLGCMDIVLTRLNAALVFEEQPEDTITINTERRFRLPGERGGNNDLYGDFLPELGQHDFLTDGVEMNEESFKTAYEKSFDAAEEFFEKSSETYTAKKTKLPEISLEVKAKIREVFRSCGYDYVSCPAQISNTLEKLLHARPVEHSIIARLVYLAIITALGTTSTMVANEIIGRHRLLLAKS